MCQAQVWLRLGLNFRLKLELKTTSSGWVAGEMENKDFFQLEVEVGAWQYASCVFSSSKCITCIYDNHNAILVWYLETRIWVYRLYLVDVWGVSCGSLVGVWRVSCFF